MWRVCSIWYNKIIFSPTIFRVLLHNAWPIGSKNTKIKSQSPPERSIYYLRWLFKKHDSIIIKWRKYYRVLGEPMLNLFMKVQFWKVYSIIQYHNEIYLECDVTSSWVRFNTPFLWLIAQYFYWGLFFKERKKL